MGSGVYLHCYFRIMPSVLSLRAYNRTPHRSRGSLPATSARAAASAYADPECYVRVNWFGITQSNTCALPI